VDLRGFRERWARPDERILFYVGRLVEEKGPHLIVEAAPRVLADFPKTKFVLAGTGSMTDHIKWRASNLRISDRIVVAGFITDAERNRLLRVADAAIFPSLYEPFGIVALEAMAAKCPVIVSDVGGLGEVVRQDENGVKVLPDNVDSLAWGIEHILKDPKAAKSRAATAYRMVKAEYNWDRIAERTAEVYKRIAQERARTDW
jgi:glycosyltransferase involved in cell wall biosynthesis